LTSTNNEGRGNKFGELDSIGFIGYKSIQDKSISLEKVLPVERRGMIDNMEAYLLQGLCYSGHCNFRLLLHDILFA